MLVVGAAGASWTWRALPWKTTHAELRASKEPLPPHERIAAVWWSDAGWAIAVGAKGQVLRRDASAPGTDESRWSASPSVTSSDLVAVAGGRIFWGREYAIVVGDGAILECTEASCGTVLAHDFVHGQFTLTPLLPKGHLRAVAVGDGEALVVGDEGTVLRIVPWFTDLNVPLPTYGGVPLRVDPIGDVGVVADFRAVDLACADDPQDRCEAVITATDGTVVRGVRTGRCDDGSRMSGSQGSRCTWTWTREQAPAPHPVDRTPRAWTPVVLVSSKLMATREQRDRALVTLGEHPVADVDGVTLPLHVDRRFVAAFTPYGGLGAASLLIDDEGDAYVAR